MARTLVLFLIFFSAQHCAQAQNNNLLIQQINESSFTVIAQAETIMMKDSLLLSDTQLIKVDTINRNYFKGLGSISGEGLDPEGRKIRIEGLGSSRMLSLEAILTDQQYQQYLGIIERRKQGRQHR